MTKLKEEKCEHIQKAAHSGGLEGSGLTPPPTLAAAQNVSAPTPTVIATPMPPVSNQPSLGSEQRSWAVTDPTPSQIVSSGYGSSQSPPVQTASFGNTMSINQTEQLSSDTFGLQSKKTMQPIMPQYPNNSARQQPAKQSEQTRSTVLDPFDGMSTLNASAIDTASPSVSSYTATQVTHPKNNGFDQFSLGSSYNTTPSAQPSGFDPFSGNNMQSGESTSLSEADLSLFKY